VTILAVVHADIFKHVRVEFFAHALEQTIFFVHQIKALH